MALGAWQWERRAWKLDLIARVEARVHAAPVPLPSSSVWRNLTPDAFEYRRVRMAGSYLRDRETLVQAVTERGPGFWVLTPLRTTAGTILVNRGFVPSGLRGSSATRAPEGPVSVTGLMRVSEPGGGFLRANDPGANRWYSRDVAAIARARRLTDVAPFFVDAEASADPRALPVGGLTVIRFSNNHLVYALTWFGLAGLCGFAAVRVWRERGVR
ncbi:surfeit locus 1 family protein [Novosphingobium chloroacetimidivorans]|uniref:SURF1-like protein n=1 Tax=Novosphingobium chloroacetimidivorans TaxID=1428314 RepID=A0A7W7K7D8_9SPHN|nr:surfeit locus 1 family protein [Novosphingobium chloroacetimidivorans]